MPSWAGTSLNMSQKEGCRDMKILNFSLADRKCLVGFKFCSLVYDGVCSVIASFEEIWSKTDFL